MALLQDFSTIRSHVTRFAQDFNRDPQDAFYYFVLNLLMGLQDDEIEDAITDTSYLKKYSEHSGNDRGIDAIIIDESDLIPIIHLFTFKYTEVPEKTSNNFPSSEIDKILSFLNDLLNKSSQMKSSVNPVLYEKVEEIWNIYERANPSYQIHLCANLYKGLEKLEKERFERTLKNYSNFEVKYHLMDELVRLLTKKDKQSVHARFKAIDKNLFEKSDGDIRALIAQIDARDLIRIVLNNEEIRHKADIVDYSELLKFSILEDAFEANVRVYLKQKTKINEGIKRTVLSEDRHRFFYFNNGITITCDRFEYPKLQRSPLVEIQNLQVVNGSQTIHALYDAMKEDPDKLEHVELLCRIYETNNSELSKKVAEFTNSQNPVNSRDIRSIDYTQQKLESELSSKGFYYERKKNQHADKPKNRRLDAEKVGQVLFAFYSKMPAEAKNQKRIIFADKYEEIFNDSVDADKVLLAYKLYERIEQEKNKLRRDFLFKSAPEEYGVQPFVTYASYYILYILGELARKDGIPLTYSNFEAIWPKYPEVVKILGEIVESEQQAVEARKEEYTHATFFKYGKPKKMFEEKFAK